jgi:hypothetical protein
MSHPLHRECSASPRRLAHSVSLGSCMDLRSRFLLALAVVMNPVPIAGQAGVPAGQQPVPACSASRPVPPLPANAEQVAAEIGVLPLVQRVRIVASVCAPAGTISLEELALRQQIEEAVLVASLDVDEVIAEINYEQAQITELRDRLSAAKSGKVNRLTVASIILGSGSSAIGTAMQFSGPATKAGDWVQIAGGAGGIVISLLALRVPGGEGNLGIAPNMLARLFGREPEVSSVYPQDVWAYLNAVPAADPRVHVTWKDELFSEWVGLGRIGPPGAPGSQQKIDRLTSGIAEPKRLSIGDLTDRDAMLMDVRARVSLMNRDLRDLMKAVAIPAR